MLETLYEAWRYYLYVFMVSDQVVHFVVGAFFGLSLAFINRRLTLTIPFFIALVKEVSDYYKNSLTIKDYNFWFDLKYGIVDSFVDASFWILGGLYAWVLYGLIKRSK